MFNWQLFAQSLSYEFNLTGKEFHFITFIYKYKIKILTL